MRTIYKYPLNVTDRQTISIKQLNNDGHIALLKDQVLMIDEQNGAPCIWAMVDTELQDVSHEIVIHGTGHACDDVSIDDYVGSFQLYGGSFVGHVFGR